MNASTQISCVIPAYNAEQFLQQTLESMLAQVRVDLEIIVVDDGSSDGTAAIAANYAGKVQLVQQPNAGHAAARNGGLAAAKGEFVTFMDADDLCPPERFSIQLRAFEEDPSLELCAAHVQNFTGDLVYTGEPLPGYNMDVLFRRSVFERVGLFDAEAGHAARLEWMLRARRVGVKERLLSDVLVYRRLHGKNMSLTQSSSSLRDYLHVLHGKLKERNAAQ